MEDNNNNDEKTIIDKGKKLVEKEGKKVAARAIKQIMPALLPVIGFVALIFLIVGLINAIPIIIQTIFASILNMFFPSSPDSALATSGSTSATESVIYIDDNGAYKLKAKDIADQLLEALEKQKVNTEVLGLKQEANESADGANIDKNMIEKYIEAEIQTTYPKTGCSGNDVDGTIIIKRATKDGTIKNLTYTSYKNFCSNVSSGNSGVLSQFSLNPNTLDLCIAREVSSTQYIGANGKELRTEFSENSENGYVKEEINYQKYVQNYSAPLNFFISLHLISQDVDFMQDLYDMVIGTGKDEPLVLTYVDSYYQSTTEYQYSGYETTHFNEYKGTNPSTALEINSIQFTATKANVEPNKPIDNSNVEGYIGSVEYYKMINTSYSGRLYVSNADTWLKSFGKDITVTSSPESEGEGSRKDEPVIDEYKDNIIYKVKDISTGEYSYWIRGGYISITRTEILTNTSTSFTVVDKESKINIDKFIELIRSYPKVENNFKTSPSNIFLMLQQTENTQRLEKIMRYVMFVLNDVDYGVTEEDLQYLLIDSFSTVRGIYGSSVEEKIWWALLDAGYSKEAAAGALGNIWEESKFIVNNVQDTCEGRVGSNEVYTEKVNNGTYTENDFSTDSVGYGLCQWTTMGRKKGLYSYASSKGANIDNPTIQINYFIAEISGKGDASSFAFRRTKGAIESEGIMATHDDWENATTVNDATLQFMRFFESPANTKSLVTRQIKAQECYDRFCNAEKPEFTEEWTYTGVSCPRYYQSDERWSSYSYPYKTGGTIRSGGCGACALAMAVSGLTGQEITPIDIVSYLNSKGINTVYNGMACAKAIAERYGLSYELINRNNKSEIDAALDKGKCLIFSIAANGIYTGNGHFIMCHGRNGDSYYVIESSKYYVSNQGYQFNQVFTKGSQGVFALGI